METAKHDREFVRRVPGSFFTIPFGIAGLAGAWRVMTAAYGSPAAVANVLFVLAAVLWLLLVVISLARWIVAGRAFVSELRDPVDSPFWSLPAVDGMLLAGGLQPYAAGTAKVLFLVFFTGTFAVAGWIVGDWIAGGLKQHLFHPGYFLATVAAGLIGGEEAASFGMQGLGWMSFGVGVLSWLFFGALILNRVLFAHLPGALVPTLAIQLAAPAVAGNAYFALHGAAPDPFAYALAGYTALSVIIELRLLSLYWPLSFAPSFWAFTFPWAASAGLAIRWLAIERPGAGATLAAAAIGAVSTLVAVIAGYSVAALVRGTLLAPGTAEAP